jgi:hypothetical protein
MLTNACNALLRVWTRRIAPHGRVSAKPPTCRRLRTLSMTRVGLSIAGVGVVVAAAAYALTIAVGWLSIGSQPGEGAPAEGVFVVGAVLALLAAAVSCFVAGIRGRRPSRVDPLIPLTAAAFVVARYYGYDPYYAPTLRRFSDDGSVAPCGCTAWSLASCSPRG